MCYHFLLLFILFFFLHLHEPRPENAPRDSRSLALIQLDGAKNAKEKFVWMKECWARFYFFPAHNDE